jgi:general secretion pathway protein A
MYRTFYHLTRKPFEMSPDPYFYFPTQLHNEALATLYYGVQRRKGFVVVTGEVGTGKTLLVRCLLDALTRNKVAFAFVYNPALSVLDFLAHMLTDLGLPSGARSKVEMLSQLNNYLMTRSARGETTALVVDEAQLLSCELLEEIRLLTNLETSQHKLLQIVLVGQPELDRKLDSHELRQLKQRVGIRCRLEPLGPQLVRGYIHQRLKMAGANSHAATIFPDETIAAIYFFSRGIPRLVNTLCETALVAGFSRQVVQVQPEMIREAAEDLRLDIIPTSQTPDTINPEDGKHIINLLTQMLEQWDDVTKKASREMDRESGVKAQ